MNWQEMADPAIVEKIGKNLRQMRLNKNISQAQLAEMSGINRVTISRIESGSDTTLTTVVQILRALGRLDIFNVFVEEAQISPLQVLKMKKKLRQRASSPRKQSGFDKDNETL